MPQSAQACTQAYNGARVKIKYEVPILLYIYIKYIYIYAIDYKKCVCCCEDMDMQYPYSCLSSVIWWQQHGLPIRNSSGTAMEKR